VKLKQICAVILMLFAIGGLGFSIIYLINESRVRGHDIFAILLISIPSILALYLIISEKLYSKTESDIVEQENKILKLKIEQQKLKEQLQSS
jgi:disulfide bond formation protein DsbB